jgi:hypothetical protein
MSGSSIIMLVVSVLLLIGAVIRNIDWRSHAVKWVGNNPVKSQHYIAAGDTVHTVEGHRILMAGEGQTYVYEDTDGETYICDVTKEYPYKYIRGRRIIGQSDGELVSDPLGFFRHEQLEQINEGLTEISKLAEGSVLIAAIHSIKSNKTKTAIMTWILVGVIAVGGFLYWRNSQKPVEVNTANITQEVTTVSPPAAITTKPPSGRVIP